MTIFVLEDDFHAEWKGRFATYEEAFTKVKRLSTLPWNGSENQCPCTSWRTCHRTYVIHEYDDGAGEPWRHVRSLGTLEVSHAGSAWEDEWANLQTSGKSGY